ncbi:MAG: ATP-binding cassette domain-containing protein [Deltaproteobacteria bacterium]|nr:ATP-binding cassette domain-containing protein [Deltaproteobacteria bacterium]
MIEIQNLTKRYGHIKAVENISFTVQKGEILGFLGPNGAGKTTTMRVLTGYFPPTDGKVKVAGYDITEKPLEVKKRIGYLPENVALYKDMRVIDYLKFVGRVKGIKKSPKLKQQVSNVIELCGIGDMQKRIIGKLSKGYRQRVGLAQALLGDPEVLILDEPTVGLDPKQIVEIRKLIKELGGERTIILSTHILPEVQMICERVIIINDGKIAAIDTPDNLNRQLSKQLVVLMEIEGDPQKIVSTLENVDGVIEVKQKRKGKVKQYEVITRPEKDIRRDLAQAVFENQLGLYELKTVEMSLEEIFLKLVTQEEHHA